MKRIEYNIHDMIETPGFVSLRLYSVTAILLGATDQESVIEMEPIDCIDASNVDGRKTLALVPLELLTVGINAGIFNHTPANKLG